MLTVDGAGPRKLQPCQANFRNSSWLSIGRMYLVSRSQATIEGLRNAEYATYRWGRGFTPRVRRLSLFRHDSPTSYKARHQPFGGKRDSSSICALPEMAAYEARSWCSEPAAAAQVGGTLHSWQVPRRPLPTGGITLLMRISYFWSLVSFIISMH